MIGILLKLSSSGTGTVFDPELRSMELIIWG